MAEEKNESQKFQSGTVYKKDQTDYSAILKQAEQTEKVEQKPYKPKPKPKPQEKKEKPEDKFKALLSAAINRDDEDEDDAFEVYEMPTPKDAAPVKEKQEKPEKKETVNKPEVKPVKEATVKEQVKEIKEEVKKEYQVTAAKEPEKIIPKPDVKPEVKPAIEKPIAAEKPVAEKSAIKETVKQPETPVKAEEKKPEDPDKLETLEELLEKNKKEVKDNGKIYRAIDLILSEEALQKGKTINKVFNPNPPKHLIEGHDFNDPYLDDIYNYTYPEQMVVLRMRKEEERQKKIAAQLEEEKKQEEKKSKRQKKHDKKKAKTEKLMANTNIKPRKQLKVPAGYPKEYEDPTDIEIDEKTGKPYYYFNFTKTVHNSKLRFLEKIIPVAAIDDVIYDKGFLDGIADRQHEKSIRLNNMSAEEQYARDLRNLAIKIAAGFVFMLAVFCKVTLGIIPDKKYATAISTMESMDFENSYYQFTELGNKELSIYFAKYSEAKMFFKVGKYQEAKEAFTLLLPFEDDIFKKRGIKIEDEINECSYQIALNYYYDGDFETAKDIFRSIHTYSDSTQRYYECGFKIAKDAYEGWQDIDDLKKALKYFYRVRKYSTEDITGYIKTIQDELYARADSAYKAKDFETAIDLFKYLAIFNYTNSEDGANAKEMVYQCTYRYGLDFYKNRKYESARKVLSEIPEYKDSYVLSKECIYNIAKILYENNPVGSIAEYNKIVGYRDSDEIRNSARLIMYGEWDAVEMNGSAITPVTFSFYDDGQFKTNKQIMAIAISTAASPIYYEWDGEKFVALDGQYTITPRYDEQTERMIITCSGPGQQFDYKCVRSKTYEEMVLGSEDEHTETAQETINQKYQNLINAYIGKKTDHIVTMDGQDIDIFENNTD